MSETTAEHWDSLVAQARLHLTRGDGTQLLEVAQDLMTADPEDEYGFRMAAEAHLQQGDAKEAIRFGKRALQCAPESDWVLYRLGMFHHVDDEIVEAERCVTRAVEIDPEVAAYWTGLGEIALADEDPETARRCANRALELDPEDADTLRLKAKTHTGDSKKDARAGLAELDRALEADPEDPWTWDAKTDFHLKLKEWKEAEASARQALLLDPSDRYLRKQLYKTLKGSSLLYRFLRWPGDLVMKGFGLISKMPWPVWIAICLVGIGSRFLLLLIAVGLLWLLLFFPVIRVYEYVRTADIRSRAREIGARQGGLFGFHGWPMPVRLGIFLLLAGGFWYLAWKALTNETVLAVFAVVIVIAFLLMIALGLWGWVIERREKKRAKRRRRELDQMGETP